MKALFTTLMVLGVLFSSVAQAEDFAWYSAEKYVQKEQDRVAKLEKKNEVDELKAVATKSTDKKAQQLVSASEPLSE